MTKDRQSGPSHPDAVFIGSDTTAKIVSISGDKLTYLDANGTSHDIALAECSRKIYVAFRFLDEPPWAVQFFDPESTVMEFESYDLAYMVLLNTLGENGWHTLDAT